MYKAIAVCTDVLVKNLPGLVVEKNAALAAVIATSILHCMVKKLKKLAALPVLKMYCKITERAAAIAINAAKSCCCFDC